MHEYCDLIMFFGVVIAFLAGVVTHGIIDYYLSKKFEEDLGKWN